MPPHAQNAVTTVGLEDISTKLVYNFNKIMMVLSEIDFLP